MNTTNSTGNIASQTMPPQRRHFGTDGIRGVANTELTAPLAMSLGAATAQRLRSSQGGLAGGKNEIIVGRDPRLSGDLLEAALVAGICSQGVQATVVGVLPTPGVAYLTRQRGALAGVVISASHNPVQDNGLKLFGPDGRKFPDAVEVEIEAAMQSWESHSRPAGAEVGRIVRTDAPIADYSEFLRRSCDADLSGLRLVVDCANGAAFAVGPALLRSLGAEVTLLSCEPDGVNINANCGSLHPETLALRVRDDHADAGLAFDGDADRVILVDEQGRIFDGDRILCMMGLHLSQRGKLTNNVVVGTIMSNLGLEKALARANVRLERASVGDRYVAQRMAETGAIIGGEKSGHILFPHLATTGDGLLTALQVLCVCRNTNRSLASWADEMAELPQTLVGIKVRDRDGWQSVPSIAQAIERAEAQLAGRGRINVRASGTEKVIRVMVEGPDLAEVNTIVQSVADTIRTDRGI